MAKFDEAWWALAAAPRFTEAQEERIRALAAYGPLTFDPATDPALAAAGWIERYDDTDAVDLSEVATRAAPCGTTAIFDANGTMHPWRAWAVVR